MHVYTYKYKHTHTYICIYIMYACMYVRGCTLGIKPLVCRLHAMKFGPTNMGNVPRECRP